MGTENECKWCPLGSPKNEACPIFFYCAIFKEDSAKLCPVCASKISCRECLETYHKKSS